MFAAAATVLTACASAPAGQPSDSPALGEIRPAPPASEVIAGGTVLETNGSAELCLGPVAESYPPQCSGIPLVGWAWEDVDGYESAADATWGTYAVQGTFDGTTFTVTSPAIMLALYDPMMREDPTNGAPGRGDDQTLTQISDELAAVMGEEFLAAAPADGWLWVDVVWDDGTWQDAVDAAYGDDMVVVRSAMQPITG